MRSSPGHVQAQVVGATEPRAAPGGEASIPAKGPTRRASMNRFARRLAENGLIFPAILWLTRRGRGRERFAGPLDDPSMGRRPLRIDRRERLHDPSLR
jgi:hypothetical protein